MSKKIKIVIVVFFIILVGIVSFKIYSKNDSELIGIKSDKQLLRIYENKESTIKEIFTYVTTMPFSFFDDSYWGSKYYINTSDAIASDSIELGGIKIEETTSNGESLSKDYSTTNIQVENVDEADITKTDGNYIYSISENNVIITNVINPEDIKIEATIETIDGTLPEDLILYKNELIVIYTKIPNNDSYYYGYNSKNNTIVKIYNIENKSNPILIKDYELNQPYYTSRCINNVLYVISSGRMRKEDNKINRAYVEDKIEKQIELNNIKYLKDVETKKQTIISIVDLDNVKSDIRVTSYLMDISNAYVSENSIYLLDENYEYKSDVPPISELFGLKGVIGIFDYEDNSSNSRYKTNIYKFDISSDGNVSYSTKTKIAGKTINQYSLDERNGHLRIALYDDDGSRIAIFDEQLNKIGISEYVAKGEKMYSSRFMGDKVYLVTFKTMDPLFVIDISDETRPQILGELKIPGYSTYLHPYDENHLIGIGMQTEEVVRRNSSGKVISTTSKITGMKMALFDVSDVNKPIQISETIIGDSRTTSAILTNPKALLFSKEKSLIAIPVNNYNEAFEVNDINENYSSVINSYTNYNKKRVAEGYFVYNINVEEGFKLKGVITHEIATSNKIYNNYNNSKLLRGLYIDNNLYTVSETAIKVNKLDTLELIDELKIKED